MSAMLPVWVGLGAGIGAPLRFLTDRAVQRGHDSTFPWGTFTVNALACLVLGLVTAAGAAAGWNSGVLALLTTGVCGAYSTYSTFSYETLGLIRERAYLFATANVAINVVAGLGAASLGLSLGSAW